MCVSELSMRGRRDRRWIIFCPTRLPPTPVLIGMKRVGFMSGSYRRYSPGSAGRDSADHDPARLRESPCSERLGPMTIKRREPRAKDIEIECRCWDLVRSCRASSWRDHCRRSSGDAGDVGFLRGTRNRLRHEVYDRMLRSDVNYRFARGDEHERVG
jgi:hypothetical protein